MRNKDDFISGLEKREKQTLSSQQPIWLGGIVTDLIMLTIPNSLFWTILQLFNTNKKEIRVKR